MGTYLNQLDDMVAAQAQRRKEIKAWATSDAVVGVPPAFSFEQDFDLIEEPDEEVESEQEEPTPVVEEAPDNGPDDVVSDEKTDEVPVEPEKKETAAQRKKREAAEAKAAEEG